MGQVQSPQPVMLLIAAFSRYDVALDWAREWAIQRWGPIALESPRFEFTETDYYQQQMGSGLRKTFFVLERLIDPAELVGAKLAANQAEHEYARQAGHAEPRPLNLDPGYLSESKLVLASTKDHAHRLYLDQGIFAEMTLRFRRGRWQPWDWTYPDYRRDDFQEFFLLARNRYRQLLRETASQRRMQ